MKQLDFEELWKYRLFDYKDLDLLVLDNISRMDFSAYENTALSFLATGYCDCGSMNVVIEGREYLITAGDLFVYMPGQRIDRMSKSPDASVKVMAFPRSAVIRSLYLDKYVWQTLNYLREHPLFTLTPLEREGVGHYHRLLMLKVQKGGGDFGRDVVRLLFQSMMLELLMLADRRRLKSSGSEAPTQEKDASVRQSVLVFRRFMTLLSESGGMLRSVSACAGLLNVTPKYLCKCVREQSGRPPLYHIHTAVADAIRQQLRYSDKTVKEIATALDFPSLSFFGRFVREHLGMSPTAFRRQSLQSQDSFGLLH